jgi:hypothetical protein
MRLHRRHPIPTPSTFSLTLLTLNRLHLSEQFQTENEHTSSAKDEGTRLQPYRRYSDLSSTSDLASDHKGR